ncbi:MAG TPA: 6-bladed beta-propeller [Firmicutes bacterium]|nr:6-bladed beta-propeller [Bacillota bacterium]
MKLKAAFLLIVLPLFFSCRKEQFDFIDLKTEKITSIKEVSEITDVTVLSDSFVILDGLSRRLVACDKEFKNIEVIARRGKGPGELWSRALYMASGDNIYIIDQSLHRINIFDRSGFIDTINIPQEGLSHDITTYKTDRLILGLIPVNTDKLYSIFNMKEKKFEEDLVSADQYDNAMKKLSMNYTDSVCTDDHLFVGYTFQNKIAKYDLITGEKIKEIKQPFLNMDSKAYNAAENTPERFYVTKMQVYKKNLYVLCYDMSSINKGDEPKITTYLSVYDLDLNRQKIYTIDKKFRVFFIHDDIVYFFRENEVYISSV